MLDSDFNTSDEAEGDDEGAGGGDSDGEVEGRKKRKTKRVLTRAYKARNLHLILASKI